MATSPARAAVGISATTSVNQRAMAPTMSTLTTAGSCERPPAASVEAVREELAPIGMPELTAAAMLARPIATSSPLTSSSSSWRRAAVLATSRPSATVSTAMASAVPNRSAHVERSSEGNESDGRPDGISPRSFTPSGSSR